MDPVAHFDIPVTDPTKAQVFYADLFGWNIQEIPGMNYWMVYTTETDQKMRRPKNPGAINGGMAKVADAGGITQPYFTVEVADVDATLAKAVATGGQVLRPKVTGQWGSMAVFADPDGNVIGLHHGNG